MVLSLDGWNAADADDEDLIDPETEDGRVRLAANAAIAIVFISICTGGIRWKARAHHDINMVEGKQSIVVSKEEDEAFNTSLVLYTFSFGCWGDEEKIKPTSRVNRFRSTSVVVVV